MPLLPAPTEIPLPNDAPEGPSLLAVRRPGQLDPPVYRCSAGLAPLVGVTVRFDQAIYFQVVKATPKDRWKEKIASWKERWETNRAENSHQPFRGRERAMLRFRRMHSLQKFASVHGSVHNHFSADRSLTSRNTYRATRTAALLNWRALCAD